MANDPDTMLKLLFAITQSEIDRDIVGGKQNFEQLVHDVHASYLEHRESKDLKIAAQYNHKHMVRAKLFQFLEDLPEEERLFFAATPASNIAEKAVEVAHQRGRLAELARQMKEIQKRERLKSDEEWSIGEGPEDYQKLMSQSNDLYEKVHDTVFTTVLRRYRLNDVADLYERDRPRYDELMERGRTLVLGSDPKN